ncbi:MAG: hypothetical protein ACR2JW_07940 [Thermomicrobiales bacterium]
MSDGRAQELIEAAAKATRPVALHRRRFLAVTGGMAASAILAACGGSAATDTPKPAAPTASAPTTAASSVATTSGATTAGTTAAGSAASGTRPVGSTTSDATTSGTTAANTSASGTGAAGTRPVGSAVTTGSVTSGTTTASGSASAGTGGQTLVVEATEYSFKTLGSVPAGATTVQLKNLGKEDHEAQFVRLNDGVTVDQFLTAIQQAGQGEPPPIFTYEGGPAQIVPNKTAEVMLNFQAGQYVLLCFVNAPDGQPHAAKGMVLPITVNAATGSAAALPAGKGTITLGTANGFDLPATLPAGKSQYRVTNQGAGPHAFFFGSIPADKTIDDVNASLASQDSGPPPWFQSSGGMDGLKPNGSGVVTLDLTSGKYVAVDVAYGPDKPFAKIFTVS